MDERLKAITAFFTADRRRRWIVAAGAVGIVLIALSSLFTRAKPTQEPVKSNDTAAYVKELEERLEHMVSSIKGAGKADVMVTLQNGVEYVYANEEKTNTDHTENGSQVSVSDDNHKTVVTVDAESGKQGLLVTEIQPIVRGVVVACEGGGDETVIMLVNQAVRTALDITEKRVCVIPYYSGKR